MLTAQQIAAQVHGGQVSAREICQAALAQAEKLNSTLNALLEIHADEALRAAERIDAQIAAGRAANLPLAGVPVVVKDNICTRAGHTTCASRMLENYRSPYDATAIERVEAAGGVILGKANLDEFAMGSSTENSARGPTRNPWNLDHVSGGSSGGVLAAIAAGMAPLGLGSETGGSVRQPAAFCGLVGVKPTYGRVSRYGLVAFGSSLDQIGPAATTVHDAAQLLSVIAGHDPRDATSWPSPPEDLTVSLSKERLEGAVRGLRIGVPAEFFGEGLDPEVCDAVEAAVRTLQQNGAEVVNVSVPHAPYSVAVYYVIATAEASSNLARFDGVRYGLRVAADDIVELVAASRSAGFGAEVKRRIMLGTFVLSSGYYDAYYRRAQCVRRLIQQDFSRAFERVDVVLGPTTPTPAFRLGEKCADPLTMYLADVYTIPANLAGLPAISVPCGFSRAGLPIGLQLIGPARGEERLLQIARHYERLTDWRRTPDLNATRSVH